VTVIAHLKWPSKPSAPEPERESTRLSPQAERERQIGAASLKRLATQTERERLEGAQLRAEIHALRCAHPEFSTAQIRAHLKWRPVPTLRTIQRHIARLNKDISSACR
jgi:hypothetical protein